MGTKLTSFVIIVLISCGTIGISYQYLLMIKITDMWT